MTIIDPKTGLPIIGARDPNQDRIDFLNNLRREKESLQPDDHDWIVLIGYSLCEADARRGAIAKQTGVDASPPIGLPPEAMRHDVGPLCARCNQFYIAVADSPCPGMSFEDYLASLEPEVREDVLKRLAAGDPMAMVDPSPEVVVSEVKS